MSSLTSAAIEHAPALDAAGARLRTRAAIAAAMLLLPGIVLAPAWRLAGLGALEDDVLYYLPSRTFFAERVSAGEPLALNPYTGLDRPFLADPQSAIFYPPTWLFAVFPPLTAYAFSLWLHYTLAMAGMYRLLRGHRRIRSAAFLGSLVFAFGGFMLAHRAHFAMQNAAVWTPWVFWALQRFAQRGDARNLALAAAFGALQCFAGHVQIAALTALGSLVWLFALNGLNWRTAARWALGWAAAGLLFAVQLLPTLAYMRVCTRSQRTFNDFVEQSWSGVSAIGLALPMFFGQRTPNLFSHPWWGPSHQCEQLVYVGILPLFLALLVLRTGWRASPARRAWTILAVFAVLTALGKHGPICPLLYWLPGASVFRVPARATLLLQLALAGLAACAANDLGSRLTPARARLRSVAQRWTAHPVIMSILLLVALIAIGWLLALNAESTHRGAAAAAMQIWRPHWIIPAIAITGTFLLMARVARRWDRPQLIWAMIALIAVDLSVIGWTIDVPPHYRSATELLAPLEKNGWVDLVRQSGQRVWVVTPRADADQKPGQYIDSLAKKVANTNMLVHVRSATDYGPLQPLVYDAMFPHKPWGETVEIDPQPRLDDNAWRRPLNIGWLLLCEDRLTPPPGCALVTRTPAGYRLYRNDDAGGMAFMQDAAHPGIVVYRERSPAEFSTRVVPWPPALKPPRSGPRPRVVVSRLALPGWSAWIGDQQLPIAPAFKGLLSVEFPNYETVTIDWKYTPPGLMAGSIISLMSVAGLVAVSLRRRRPAASRS